MCDFAVPCPSMIATQQERAPLWWLYAAAARRAGPVVDVAITRVLGLAGPRTEACSRLARAPGETGKRRAAPGCSHSVANARPRARAGRGDRAASCAKAHSGGHRGTGAPDRRRPDRSPRPQPQAASQQCLLCFPRGSRRLWRDGTPWWIGCKRTERSMHHACTTQHALMPGARSGWCPFSFAFPLLSP